MLRGLLIGLVLGLPAGWLLARWASDRVEPAPAPAVVRADGATPATADPRLEARTAPEAATPGAADGAERIRTASAEELAGWASGRAEAPAFTADEARAAAARLAEAVSTGDERLLRAILATLRLAERDLEAERSLLRLMEAEDLVLPVAIGGRFRDVLERSDLPGIAAAARRRFELELAAGRDSWVAAEGWLELVARHGTAADVEWVAARDESSQIRSHAIRALARSPNPAARERFVLLLARRDYAVDSAVDEFERVSPEAAYAVWASQFGGYPGRPQDLGRALVGLARTAPEHALGDVVQRIAALESVPERLDALSAVQILRRRGVEPRGLERVTEAPLLVVEEAVSTGRPQAGLDRAVDALEDHEFLWSERAAAALEALAAALPAQAADAGNAARTIRASLRSPWKR